MCLAPTLSVRLNDDPAQSRLGHIATHMMLLDTPLEFESRKALKLQGCLVLLGMPNFELFIAFFLQKSLVRYDEIIPLACSV